MIKSLMFRCATACKFASSSLLSFALDYCLFLLFSAVTGNWAWGLLLSNIAARLISACFNSYKPSKTISDCICICEPQKEAAA